MPSSRTPEGPLNYCPLCGTHCRIEPSPTSQDAICPKCGTLLWPDSRAEDMRYLKPRLPSLEAGRYWERWTCQQLGFTEPAVVSPEDLRIWEAKFEVSLPKLLSEPLMVQNGGRLIGTNVDIYPLQRFVTLNQGEWTGLFREVFQPSDRTRLIAVGTMPGGRAVLDYREPGEPRARNLDPIFHCEVPSEYGSFADLLRHGREQRAGV